jgi:fructosamine-3-kinase
MTLSPALLQQLQHTTGQSLHNPRISSIGGGDINAAFRVQADGVDWFVKINRASLAEMFVAEAAELEELAAQRQIRVPQVVTQGECGSQAYLVLEFIPLGGLRGGSAGQLGQQLARLHRQPQAYFGWQIDNTIGSTPQHNARCDDWVEFWQTQRLGKQLQFAAANGFGGKLQSNGARLLEKIPALFSNYRPQPSLLHGDLWGGNASADDQGHPVIFDPACYYGDRETDIAMTELFGGFGNDFYAAYNAEYWLDSGYPSRKILYNLYHILNHLNLFGGGYLQQASSMIERLLAQI